MLLFINHGLSHNRANYRPHIPYLHSIRVKPTDLLDQILTSRDKYVDQVHIKFHTNKLSLHVKMLLNTKSKRIGEKMSGP